MIKAPLNFEYLSRFIVKKWDSYVFTGKNFIFYIRLADYGWTKYLTALFYNKDTNSIFKQHIKSEQLKLEDNSFEFLGET